MSADDRARPNLATTFRPDEVELMHQLVHRLLSGGDAQQLARAPAFASVARKFQLLREKCVGGRS